MRCIGVGGRDDHPTVEREARRRRSSNSDVGASRCSITSPAMITSNGPHPRDRSTIIRLREIGAEHVETEVAKLFDAFLVLVDAEAVRGRVGDHPMKEPRILLGFEGMVDAADVEHAPVPGRVHQELIAAPRHPEPRDRIQLSPSAGRSPRIRSGRPRRSSTAGRGRIGLSSLRSSLYGWTPAALRSSDTGSASPDRVSRRPHCRGRRPGRARTRRSPSPHPRHRSAG